MGRSTLVLVTFSLIISLVQAGPVVKRSVDGSINAKERAAFHQADINGDRKLTNLENVMFLRLTDSDDMMDLPDENLMTLSRITIDVQDKNGDGMLDYDDIDWSDAGYFSSDMTRKEAGDFSRSAVRIIDEDGNGKLNGLEFYKMLKIMTPEIRLAAAIYYLPTLDKNSDNEIEPDELAQWLYNES